MPEIDGDTETDDGLFGDVPPPNATRATLRINPVHNHWYVRDPWEWGNQVFADGSGPGNFSPTGTYPYPPQPFALIARWWNVSSQEGLEWHVVSEGLVLDIPKNDPGNWRLNYACNDDNYDDNGGMIEVFETFT
jgi:hypothetical protein